jgi:hypothetical protein
MSNQSKRRVKTPFAITPPDYNDAQTHAVQCLAEGEATKDQQKMALDWIIIHACMTYDEAFDLDSDRLTNLALGRQFAGKQIVKLMKLRTTGKIKDVG